MVSFWNKLNLRFQAKVLFPVVIVLALVLISTIWLVNRRMQEQLESQNQASLTTLNRSFTNSFGGRLDDLRSQCHNVPNQNGFFYLANLGNSKLEESADQEDLVRTISKDANDRLETLPPDITVFLMTSYHGQFEGGGVRAGEPFTSSNLWIVAKTTIEHTLDTGRETTSVIDLSHERFYLINFLTTDPETSNVVACLTFAIRIGNSLVSPLALPGTKVALIGSDDVMASTFENDALKPQILALTKEPHSSALLEARLEDEHYVGILGKLKIGADTGGINYVIFSSYEHSWQQFKQTRRLLVLVGVFGILLSSVIIWVVIRRVTEPVRLLRDNAEAVGRGDFSRRIEITSKDELGELSREFNRMTENLQTSTAQLEQTVETLRTTQARLMQSEKLSAIGEFVAGVAHELNNPLTALIGFSELLQMRATDESTRSSLKRISSSAERCHKIVQSLLSFARQHTPERKLTDVNSLVDAVLEILIYELRTSNIKVEKNYSTELPKLMVDPHQVQQVFLNIIHNARQAIEAYQPHGSMRITTRLLNNRVQVRFQDDGPGISPENLKKIFDPFFTTKVVGKGTGLGLSLSYGIIHEHGGTINAESQPGQGTTFIIELPIAEGAQGATSAPVEDQPVLKNEGQGRKILVVDDEVDILDLVKKTLEVNGYVVQTATEGETALRLLAEEKFDLIVSDWKMPGMSGQQLFEHLTQSNPEATRRIIFMTGDVLSEKTQEFLQRHEKICLAKPFSLREFRKTVHEMLKK